LLQKVHTTSTIFLASCQPARSRVSLLTSRAYHVTNDTNKLPRHLPSYPGLPGEVVWH